MSTPTAMTDRERFLATMRYQPRDRAPFRQFGAWPETIERWTSEGYNPETLPFRVDRWEWHGGWFHPNPPFERQVIEEDERTVLYINHEGILMRERKDHRMSSMPQFVRFPVETREDFRRFWRERMQPDLAARLGPDWKERLTAYRTRDFPLIIIADRWGGFFGPLRNLVGVQRLCTLFYDDPAFVEEMMDANADFTIQMMDQILTYTDVDVFGFWEDMAYKAGPLLGPKHARRYMLPRYRRVVDFVRSRGRVHRARQRRRHPPAPPDLGGRRHQCALPVRGAVRHGRPEDPPRIWPRPAPVVRRGQTRRSTRSGRH